MRLDPRGAPDYSHHDYAAESRALYERGNLDGAADKAAGKEPNAYLYRVASPDYSHAKGYRDGYGTVVAEQQTGVMFSPPFCYLPMPVNKDGNGPADEADTYRIIHEVWDGNCETVCECRDEATARWVAEQLTAYTDDAVSQDDGQPTEQQEWADYDPDC